MFSLMRKYGKWVLAILGVVLMIIWLNPRGNRSGSDSSTVEKGTLNGKSITNTDLNRAAVDVTVLKALINSPDVPITNTSVAYLKNIAGVLGSLDPHDPIVHFFLLLNEAQKYGVDASMDEVASLISGLSFSDPELQRFIENLQITSRNEQVFRDALRDYYIVSKFESLAIASLHPSLPQLQHLADDTQSTVSFHYITLDANVPAKDLPQPSADAIQKQFDSYRGVLPETAASNAPLINNHHFPFAYKYPDRVKIEFLVFDRKAIRGTLKLDAADVKKIHDYYDNNLDKFQTTPTTGPSTSPGFMETGPTTTPAVHTRPFEEVKDEIVELIMGERTARQIVQMTDAAAKLAADPWDKATIDSTGFHDHPGDVKIVAYPDIAQQIQNRYGYLPTYQSPKGWLDRTQLRQVPGIGAADLRNQQQRLLADFPSFALHVKEIAGTQKLAGQALQVSLEGPLLTDPAGNIYLYRVVAAQPNHEPKSLDEAIDDSVPDVTIRNHVVADLQRIATYNQYLAQAASLANEAAKNGIYPTADSHSLFVDFAEPFSRLTGIHFDLTNGTPKLIDEPTFPLRPTAFKNLGPMPALADAAFKLAAATVPPTTAPAETSPATAESGPATTSRPAATTASRPDAAPGNATSFVGVDSVLKVFVFQIVAYHPFPSNAFDAPQVRQILSLVAEREEQPVFIAKWGRLEDIAARLNYKPKTPFGNRSNDNDME